MEKPRYFWLVICIWPGLFSGIAALLLLIPIVGALVASGAGAPWFILIIDAFGWLSLLVALGVLGQRDRFVRVRRITQIRWAALTWAVHLTAFAWLLVMLFS